MGAWQPLPEGLPPEVRHFVEQLRLLKDRTGLSLVALGARTAYSKSSWQRYLNATQPPPPGKQEDAGPPLQETPAAAEHPGDDYEDDPTLPWWDAPLPARPSPSRRLLTAAVVLAALLALAALIGALAFG
ncbi:helix-turn-helix domain-containing protein [Streptomyces sp. NPDC003514]